MRNLLCKRGLLVPKGSGTPIVDALYEVVQEDLDWPKDERESS